MSATQPSSRLFEWLTPLAIAPALGLAALLLVMSPDPESPLGEIAGGEHGLWIPAATFAGMAVVFKLSQVLSRLGQPGSLPRMIAAWGPPAALGGFVGVHYRFTPLGLDVSGPDAFFLVALFILLIMAGLFQAFYRIPALSGRLEAMLGDRHLFDVSRPSSTALVFDVVTLSLMFAAANLEGLGGVLAGVCAPLGAVCSILFYRRSMNISDELHRRIMLDGLAWGMVIVLIGGVLCGTWLSGFLAGIEGVMAYHWTMIIYLVFAACLLAETARRTPEAFKDAQENEGGAG